MKEDTASTNLIVILSKNFKEEEDLTYDGGKINPEEWSEYLEQNPYS